MTELLEDRQPAAPVVVNVTVRPMPAVTVSSAVPPAFAGQIRPDIIFVEPPRPLRWSVRG
jgi:hypothetical protein